MCKYLLTFHSIMFFASKGDARMSFESMVELTAHPHYEQFALLDVCGCKLTSLPDPLPPKLQILLCDKNIIHTVPQLPITLRQLSIATNKLVELPDMSQCLELEDVSVRDNYIETFDATKLPLRLRTMDSSFNPIKFVDYDALPWDTLANISFSFCNLKHPPPPHIARGVLATDHCDFDDRPKQNNVSFWDDPDFVPRGVPDFVPMDVPVYNARVWATERQHVPHVPQLVVFNDAQNVHKTSIQNSVLVSLNVVMDYRPKKEYDHVKDIEKLFWSKAPWWLKLIGCTWMYSVNVRDWCMDNTMHSRMGVTFDTLLHKVWAIVVEHEHSDALKGVLLEELRASAGMCFTGKFTRVLNTLSGFIDGVSIEISPREQMMNRIALVMRRDDVRNKKRAVSDILDEFEVTELVLRNEWLQYIDDDDDGGGENDNGDGDGKNGGGKNDNDNDLSEPLLQHTS